MTSVSAFSGHAVGTCPGCGYPVIGLQPCAACAPLVTADQRAMFAAAAAGAGPVVAA